MPPASTALKVHVATAVGVLPLVGVTTSGANVVYDGHVRVGTAVSLLVTVNVHVFILLALSVTEHVMVVTPSVVAT